MNYRKAKAGTSSEEGAPPEPPANRGTRYAASCPCSTPGHPLPTDSSAPLHRDAAPG